MSFRNLLPSGVKKTFAFFLFSFLITCFIACNNDKVEGEKTSMAAPTTTIQMNCALLDRSQVQVWVDSGWTNPENPSKLMKKILLQFYTADAANTGTNMQLMSFPGKSYTDIYNNGKNYLKIDTTCKPMILTGPTSLSNNYINFEKLGITDAKGNLTEFDFIRLRPVKVYSPYINFEIEIVRLTKEGTEVMAKGGSTDPCPPICP